MRRFVIFACRYLLNCRCEAPLLAARKTFHHLKKPRRAESFPFRPSVAHQMSVLLHCGHSSHRCPLQAGRYVSAVGVIGESGDGSLIRSIRFNPQCGTNGGRFARNCKKIGLKIIRKFRLTKTFILDHWTILPLDN